MFNWAHTYLPNCRRSHIFRRPSSPPETSRGSVWFHDITLTSVEWACTLSMHALSGLARQSQIRTDWSTEQDANTWNYTHCGLLVPIMNIKPHTGFIRTPLNILHRLSVAYKCTGANLPNTLLSRFPYVHTACAVSRGQSSRHCGRPGQSIALNLEPYTFGNNTPTHI